MKIIFSQFGHLKLKFKFESVFQDLVSLQFASLWQLTNKHLVKECQSNNPNDSSACTLC